MEINLKSPVQLFEWIEEGFVSAEVIRDDTGTIMDWRYVDVNTAAQKNAGLRASDLIGRLASETPTGLDPWWLQSVRYVMESQQSEHLEQHVPTVDRWFEITMFPFGPDGFGVLYYDITVKKRRDLDSAFLHDVSSELLNLSTPQEMIRAVGELIGEYLKVLSCSFSEIDEVRGEVSMLYRWSREGAPVIKKSFRLKDYVSDAFNIASRAGQLFIVENTASDDRADAAAYAKINVGAVLAVPFIRHGRWVATAAITNATPRHWLDEEIALFQEVTNKVFSRIERADAEEALRRSEEKYRMLFESIDEGFCLIELIYDEKGRPVDWRYLDANPAFERRTGKKPIGRKVSELVPKVKEARLHFLAEVARTRMPARMEDQGLSIDRWFNIYASPAGDTGDQLAVIFDDITERKLGEIQLAKDLEDMRILQQISNRLMEETGIQSLYDAILDSAVDLVKADFATVQALIPGKNELYLLAQRNLHPDSVRHWQHVKADATCSCSQALMTRNRVIVQDLENCPFELSKEDYDAYHISGVVSMQTTPLLSRTGMHVGMLSTGWKEPHTPSARDLNVLDVVARQAADIIEQKQAQEALRGGD
jgi:PAS domain S-box-containing protein